MSSYNQVSLSLVCVRHFLTEPQVGQAQCVPHAWHTLSTKAVSTSFDHALLLLVEGDIKSPLERDGHII